jgi:hypothetical protein
MVFKVKSEVMSVEDAEHLSCPSMRKIDENVVWIKVLVHENRQGN